MQIDLEYLREHYASLSDRALRAIDRASLVDAAQKCYDDELARRSDLPPEEPGDDPEYDIELPDSDEKPEWLEDAAEVYSWTVLPGTAPARDAVIARDALVDAGVPCYLELFDAPPENSAFPETTQRWRLMVPGKLNLRATSILECEIQNPEFEAEWKTHLEALSDQELREMNPQVAYAGLMDRIERVTRVYDEELARRKLTC